MISLCSSYFRRRKIVNQTFILCQLIFLIGYFPFKLNGQISPKVDSQKLANLDLILVEKAANSRITGNDQFAITKLIAKKDSIDKSLEWFINHMDNKDAFRFAIAMSPFWFTEGRIEDGRNLFDKAFRMLGENSDLTLLSRAYYEAGLLAFRQKDQNKSRFYNNKSVMIARTIQDTPAIVRALVGLSRVDLRSANNDSVLIHAGEASRLLQKTGKENSNLSAIHMIAAVERMTGHDEEAGKIYENNLRIYKMQGNESGAAGELVNLGYVRLHQHKLKLADSLFNQAKKYFFANKDYTSLYYLITAYASLCAESGYGKQSATLFGSAVHLLTTSNISFDPDDQYEYEKYRSVVIRSIGKPTFDKEYEKGEKITLDNALKIVNNIKSK